LFLQFASFREATMGLGTEQAIAKVTSSSAKNKNNNQLVLLFSTPIWE